MEAKNKNVCVVYGQSRRIGDSAVSMGLGFPVTPGCLELLKNNQTGNECYTGAEFASTAFALFESIRDKMVGSPLEVSRSKVSRVDCNSIGDELVISWNTQASFSAIRKTMALALSCLHGPKLYSKYAENCKLLGCKSDRSVFNECSNRLTDAIKKEVKFAVVSKAKVDATKLKDLITKVSVKVPKQESLSGAKKPEKHAEHKREYPSVKATGINAVVVADYIRSKSGGMGVYVLGDEVVVYNTTWTTKQKALKVTGRINDYVRQKYEKLDKDFANILAYVAISQGFGNASTVAKILKSKPSPASMKELLKKSL
jgi:hypothetical protein